MGETAFRKTVVNTGNSCLYCRSRDTILTNDSTVAATADDVTKQRSLYIQGEQKLSENRQNHTTSRDKSA